MGINIKKHFINQLIVVSCVFLVLATEDHLSVSLYIEEYFLFGLLILSIYNSCLFIKKKFIDRNIIENRILLIGVIFPVFLLGMLFSALITIPVLIIELVLILFGKRYIGNKHYNDADIPKKKLSYYFEENQLKKRLNLYERNKWYKIIWIFAVMGIYFLFIIGLNFLYDNIKIEFINYIQIIGFITLIGIYRGGNSFLNRLGEKILAPIITEECDSKLYCNIYEKIMLKYDNCISIASYCYGLQFHSNQWKLRFVLDNYKKYQNKEFYILAKLEMTDISYEERTLLYKKLNKIYKRNIRNESSINTNKLLEIKGFIELKKYQEALKTLEEINKKVMIDTIIYHYYKGKCLYFLERYFEAKEMFSYVVENGNTLYFVELSKVYLTDIKLL